MKRAVRVVVIVAATVIVASTIALLAARLYFTDERILSLVRPRLARQLNRPFEIKGAQLSFWGGLGVRLEQVTLGNAPGFGRPHLVHLRAVDVKVRFWPLVKGEIVPDRVLVGPGEVRLEINELGRNNWTGIARGDTARAPATPADSALASVPRIPIAGNMEFTDVTISLDDHQRVRMFELTGISGRSATAVNTADTTVTAQGEFCVAGGEVLSKGQSWKLGPLRPDLRFDVMFSPVRRRLDLRTVTLTVLGAPIEIAGVVERLGGPPAYSLKITVPRIGLADVFAQVPDSLWRPYFPGGPPEGSAQAELAATSPPIGERLPMLDGRILVSEVRGRIGERNIPLAATAVTIRFARTVISASTQGLTVAELPLTASLTIDQLQAPNFSGGVSGDVDLAAIAGVLYPGAPIDAGGRLKFTIAGFGAVKDWRRMNLSGRVDLSGFRWRTPDTTALAIDDLSGTIKFSGTEAQIEKLSVRSGPSQVDISGTIARLVPYLVRGGRGPDKPHLQFALTSPFVDWDRLIPEDSSTAALAPLPIIDLIADGTIRMDSAVYFNVPVTEFDCQAHFADLTLALTEARGRVYGGAVTGTATVDYRDWNNPVFVIDANAEHIEANQFIDRFTGFGGHLFGNFNLSGTFGGQGEEVADILPTLTAKGEMAMTDGRFEKLDVLSALGAQAGIGGIRDSGPIKDMLAYYWIADGRLYCRDWSFVSSGAQYAVSGSVGFDGSLDYRIRIDLPKSAGGGDVLSALGQMLGGGSGGIALNLALTGTYSQPAITLDTRENQQRFEQNLKAKARGLLEGLRKR